MTRTPPYPQRPLSVFPRRRVVASGRKGGESVDCARKKDNPDGMPSFLKAESFSMRAFLLCFLWGCYSD